MILLDTIAYNTFLDLQKGRTPKVAVGLKFEEFQHYILNYDGQKFVHSATLFEIYIKSFKSQNQDLTIFIETFNSLKKYNIQILNDSTWYFDWKSLLSKPNEMPILDLTKFVKDKVYYEVTGIFRYFVYILLVVSDKLFDDSEEEVSPEIFELVISLNVSIIKDYLEDFLNEYYLTNERKESSVKKFDTLLYYILMKIEMVIKEQLTIIDLENLKIKKDKMTSILVNSEDISKFLSIRLYEDYNDLIKMNGSGVQKAKKILRKYDKKTINSTVENIMNSFESKLELEGRRTLSKNERLYYQRFLIPRALQQGYKVTKNDFSDCIIFSAFDTIKEGENGKIITFDKNLKNLMKDNDVYYDQRIYEYIFD